jgi:hypothetical protein
LGELSAMTWLASQGATVSLPVFHCRDYDVIADFGHGLPVRVQVKTGTCFRNGRWEVSVCTRGGNQSWSGLVKRLDPANYDWLFAHVGDGRRWFIPAAAVASGCAVLLGGPKYDAFEVDSGDPLPAWSSARMDAA